MSRRSDAVNPQGRHHVPSLTPLSESLPIDDTVLSVYDQRTVYLVNIFIVDTVRFLNRFSAICEEKLMEVHSKMLKLDSTLTLLEAELRSIDECRGPKQCCGIETDGDLDGSMQQDTSSDSNLKEHLIRSGTDGLDVQSPKASLDKQINIMNEDDPRMLEFQRMLRFGVPEETLKMQLIMEGFDASSLNLFILDDIINYSKGKSLNSQVSISRVPVDDHQAWFRSMQCILASLHLRLCHYCGGQPADITAATPLNVSLHKLINLYPQFLTLV